MPQAPFNIVLQGMNAIQDRTDISLDEQRQMASELLSRTGWESADFKRNAKYVEGRTSAGQTAGTGVMSGLSLNLADEIWAGLDAAADVLKGKDFGESYEKAKGVYTAVEEEQARKYPGVKLASEVTGSLVTPAGMIGQAGKWGTRLATGIGTGAVEGGASGEGLWDRLQKAAIGAAGGVVGQGASEALRGVVRPFAAPGNEVMEAATRQGYPVTPGMVGTPQAQRIERAMRNPLTEGTAERAAERVTGELEAAHGSVGQRLAAEAPFVERTPVTAGGRIKEIAQRTKAGVNDFLDKEANRVLQATGPDTPVDLTRIEALRQKLVAEAAAAPQTYDGIASHVEARRILNSIVNDAQAGGGKISFASVNRRREDLGAGKKPKELSDVYKALRESLLDTAGSVSPEVRQMREQFNKFVTDFRQGEPIYAAPAETLNSLIKAKTPQRAWNLLVNGTPKEIEQLHHYVNQHGGKGAWDAISASLWNTMGDKKGQFDLGTFIDNWQSMDPTRRTQIFRGSQFQKLLPEINDFATVTKSWRETGKAAGSGRLAGPSQLLGMLGLGGLGTAGYLAAGPKGMALAALPWAGSKLLFSQRGVRTLNRLARARTWQSFAATGAELASLLDPDDQQTVKAWLAEQQPAGGG